MQTLIAENPAVLLERRLRVPQGPALRMTLHEVSWIHYVIPAERLAGKIPEDRFEIFRTGDSAWLSVVTFRNVLFPGFSYRQTNLRTYVLDRNTGEPAVWFFGFLTDTPLTPLYRKLGRSPHCPARFHAEGFGYRFESEAGNAEAAIHDTGQVPGCLPGFSDAEAMNLILLHPVRGYFRDTAGGTGRLSIWHPKIVATAGEIRTARFEPLEREGLLSVEEAAHPAGVFLSPRVPFLLLP